MILRTSTSIVVAQTTLQSIQTIPKQDEPARSATFPHLVSVVERLGFELPKAAFSRLLDKVHLDSNRNQKQECVSQPNGK